MPPTAPGKTRLLTSGLMRGLGVGIGVVLIAVAFAAATRVADTREGLIAEVITLLTALTGISLILYGMFAGVRSRRRGQLAGPARPGTPMVGSVRDLLLGGAGIVVALILLGGLAASAGVQWAGLGTVLLLPMIAGSALLCLRFLRAPTRSWKLAPPKSSTPTEP